MYFTQVRGVELHKQINQPESRLITVIIVGVPQAIVSTGRRPWLAINWQRGWLRRRSCLDGIKATILHV